MEEAKKPKRPRIGIQGLNNATSENGEQSRYEKVNYPMNSASAEQHEEGEGRPAGYQPRQYGNYQQRQGYGQQRPNSYGQQRQSSYGQQRQSSYGQQRQQGRARPPRPRGDGRERQQGGSSASWSATVRPVSRADMDRAVREDTTRTASSMATASIVRADMATTNGTTRERA